MSRRVFIKPSDAIRYSYGYSGQLESLVFRFFGGLFEISGSEVKKVRVISSVGECISEEEKACVIVFGSCFVVNDFESMDELLCSDCVTSLGGEL